MRWADTTQKAYALEPDIEKLLQVDLALKNLYNCITNKGTQRTYKFGIWAFLEYVPMQNSFMPLNS